MTYQKEMERLSTEIGIMRSKLIEIRRIVDEELKLDKKVRKRLHDMLTETLGD